MRIFSIGSLVVSITLRALLTANGDSLILNGSFESPQNPPKTLWPTTPTFWKKSRTGILNGTRPSWPAAKEGKQYIILGQNSQLSQTIQVVRPGIYQLKWFDSSEFHGPTLEAYYIVSGEVEIPELHQTFGKGALLGEIGLFTPDGRRTMTVRCVTEVHAAVLDYDRFKELYFQNPEFGFHLLHLIVGRLQEREGLLHPALPS